MKNKSYSFLFILVLFLSCQSPNDKKYKKNEDAPKYGEKIDFAIEQGYQTLYPPKISDLNSVRISSQIYNTLFTIDPKSLNIKPELVAKKEVKNNGKTYLLHLKKGVKFHKDPCFDNGTR
ncbi:MAG: hypothetical protein ABEH43_09665 [Flavobacteriales bacterium]